MSSSIGKDARSIIDQGTMSIGQWVAVMVTVGLNALDGYDVLSISFASPGIAREWGIDRAALGWVLSMELLGMGLGSVVLGGVADKAGRRPMILGCLVAMAVGMWGAGHAASVSILLTWRLLTGLGIGGMLASINATVAEVSNRRWRSLATALMVVGYPLGGIFGGLIVQRLLAGGSWRAVFEFGTWATAVFVPIVWLLLPESVSYLATRQSAGALQKINEVLERFGHASAATLANDAASVAKPSILDIFRPGLLFTTLVITFAYFAHVISFYFILKWVPKIVVDMGFTAVAAAGVLTWFNVGGATGCALFGLFGTRLKLRTLTLVALLGASAMVAWFGRGAADLRSLSLVVAAAGMFANAAIAGLYSLLATVFPPHVRATATGFAIGVGRAGSALAPVLAGYLFQAGFGLQTVALLMGSGSLLSVAALLSLRVREAP